MNCRWICLTWNTHSLEVVSFLLLDIFTKYIIVVPIQNNLEGDIAARMIEELKNEWKTGTTTYA